MQRDCFDRSRKMISELRQAGYQVACRPIVLKSVDWIGIDMPTGHNVKIEVPQQGDLTLHCILLDHVCELFHPQAEALVQSGEADDACIELDEYGFLTMKMTVHEQDISGSVRAAWKEIGRWMRRILREVTDAPAGEPAYALAVYETLLRDKYALRLSRDEWWEFCYDETEEADTPCMTLNLKDSGWAGIGTVLTEPLDQYDQTELLELVNRWNQHNGGIWLTLEEDQTIAGAFSFRLPRDPRMAGDYLTMMLEAYKEILEDCDAYLEAYRNG